MGKILNKDNETKSTYQKLRKTFPEKSDEIPESAKTILRSDFTSPNLQPKKETFLQAEFEN